MATTLRPELSERSKYHVEKHRNYELKHFCLQYPLWRKTYQELDGFGKKPTDAVIFHRTNTPSDPTSRLAEQRLLYLSKMELVEQAAFAADPDLASYILKGVTEGLSFNQLKTKFEIPCGRDMYYDRYRRFFWLLDKTRD